MFVCVYKYMYMYMYMYIYIYIYGYIYIYIWTARRELGQPSAPYLEAVGAPRSRRDEGAAIAAALSPHACRAYVLKAACGAYVLKCAVACVTSCSRMSLVRSIEV